MTKLLRICLCTSMMVRVSCTCASEGSLDESDIKDNSSCQVAVAASMLQKVQTASAMKEKDEDQEKKPPQASTALVGDEEAAEAAALEKRVRVFLEEAKVNQGTKKELALVTEQFGILQGPAEVANGDVYEGSYVCGQGITGLRVHFTSWPSAEFEFFPHGQSTHRCHGRFHLTGTWTQSTRNIAFTAGSWIENPCGYVTVGMQGTLSTDGLQYSGNIAHPGCSTFETFKVTTAPTAAPPTTSPTPSPTASPSASPTTSPSVSPTIATVFDASSAR